MKRIYLILIALMISGNCWGVDTYYPIGNPGDTYQTFTALVAAVTLGPGDDVDGQGNTFNEQWTITASGISGNEITFRNANWISAVFNYSVCFAEESYLIFDNMNFDGPQEGFQSVSATNGSQYIYIKNCTFKNLTNKGILVSSATGTPSEYIFINNCTFENIGNWGETGDADINFGANVQYTTVEDCSMSGNGIDKGVDGVVYSNEAGTAHRGFHVIRRCYFSGHEENGVDYKNTTGTTYSDNLIDDCTFSSEGGISFSAIDVHFGSKGITVRDTEFDLNYVDIAYTAAGSTANGLMSIEYCIFTNTKTRCFTDGGTIGNNRIVNSDFYNTNTDDGYCITLGSLDNIIENNIFFEVTQTEFRNGAIDIRGGVDPLRQTINYNCHTPFAGDFLYRYESTGTYLTLLTGREATYNWGNNSIQVLDPLFVNAANNDFHLTASSPCINSALAIPGVTDQGDILGFPYQGTNPDIGAYNYYVTPQVSHGSGNSNVFRSVFGYVTPGELPYGCEYVLDEFGAITLGVNNEPIIICE